MTLPVTLLVDAGTSGPAEIFAAALAGNKRAELIGEHTIGRAGMQELVKLPDGSGLWITSSRYLTPAGEADSGQGPGTRRRRRSARRRVRRAGAGRPDPSESASSG